MTIELDFLGSDPDEGTDLWAFLDNDVIIAEVLVARKGDALDILDIDAVDSKSSSLPNAVGAIGPVRIRRAFTLLAKEYPGVTRLLGLRISGTRAFQELKRRGLQPGTIDPNRPIVGTDIKGFPIEVEIPKR